MANYTAKQQLAMKLFSKGIMGDDAVAATTQKILNSAAPAKLAEMDQQGMSDDEKALALADEYFASLGDTNTDESDVTKKTDTMPTGTAMTAEDRAAISQWLDSNATATGARAAQTKVLYQITDKPVLAALHVDGAMLTPSISENFEAQVAAWKKSLVDTPDNKQKFETLIASFRKKEPQAVYINPKAREKVIGWALSTTDEQGNPIQLQVNKDNAIAFLLVSVQGVVQPRGEKSIGIRIRWTEKKKARAKDNESANAGNGTTSVVVMNRKAVAENPELSVCSCIPLEQGGQKVINDSYSAKTDAYFEVLTARFDKNHNPITRKVRLSGKTQAYKVVRKDDFVKEFGPAERAKNDGSLSKKQKQQVADAMANSIYNFSNNSSAVENNALREAMSQIRRVKKDVKGFN